VGLQASPMGRNVTDPIRVLVTFKDEFRTGLVIRLSHKLYRKLPSKLHYFIPNYINKGIF